ncbi:MAG: SEC-C metal-binding domain-containing protein [Solirubrobacteraceae bacterium]
MAVEAKRLIRSSSGVSVRRATKLADAGELMIVRDTTSASFEGDGLPLDRMTEIVEALDRPGPPTLPRRATKVPRNAPCPCGSGRKYKKCCGNSA